MSEVPLCWSTLPDDSAGGRQVGSLLSNSVQAPRGGPPLSRQHGSYKTATARLWPWLYGKSDRNVLSSRFARERRTRMRARDTGRYPQSHSDPPFRRIVGKIDWFVASPLSSENGAYKTVTARFRPRFSGDSPQNLPRCACSARKQLSDESVDKGGARFCFHSQVDFQFFATPI
jgi:hypothetical protein